MMYTDNANYNIVKRVIKMKSKLTEKRCIFCKYWTGGLAAPMTMKNYYEYDASERAKCTRRSGQLTNASFGGCSYYDMNNFKYHII